MKIAWEDLRALPVSTILAAVGADPQDPRCPRCSARLEVCDDPHYGTSLRCWSSRCRVGRADWMWPEFMIAELYGVAVDDAKARLLDASRREPIHAPPRAIVDKARSVVAAFLES